MIRLLLVDDQPALRHGLAMRFALETDIEVVGEASNGKEALDLIPRLSPDVILMDVEMPVMDGISATRLVRSLSSHSVVVILSMYDDHATQQRARQAGASAVVGKHGATDTLLATIRQADQQRS
jgi:DNA-binding NarL/FixJ family response regulator